ERGGSALSAQSAKAGFGRSRGACRIRKSRVHFPGGRRKAPSMRSTFPCSPAGPSWARKRMKADGLSLPESQSVGNWERFSSLDTSGRTRAAPPHRSACDPPDDSLFHTFEASSHTRPGMASNQSVDRSREALPTLLDEEFVGTPFGIPSCQTSERPGRRLQNPRFLPAKLWLPLYRRRSEISETYSESARRPRASHHSARFRTQCFHSKETAPPKNPCLNRRRRGITPCSDRHQFLMD